MIQPSHISLWTSADDERSQGGGCGYNKCVFGGSHCSLCMALETKAARLVCNPGCNRWHLNGSNEILTLSIHLDSVIGILTLFIHLDCCNVQGTRLSWVIIVPRTKNSNPINWNGNCKLTRKINQCEAKWGYRFCIYCTIIGYYIACYMRLAISLLSCATQLYGSCLSE